MLQLFTERYYLVTANNLIRAEKIKMLYVYTFFKIKIKSENGHKMLFTSGHIEY